MTYKCFTPPPRSRGPFIRQEAIRIDQSPKDANLYRATVCVELVSLRGEIVERSETRYYLDMCRRDPEFGWVAELQSDPPPGAERQRQLSDARRKHLKEDFARRQVDEPRHPLADPSLWAK